MARQIWIRVPVVTPHVATDDSGVCQSVCHAALLGFAVQKRQNGIDVLFGVKNLLGPDEHCV